LWQYLRGTGVAGQAEGAATMTPSVYEQINIRLGLMEQDIRALGAELHSEIAALRADLNNRFMWLVGIMVAMWGTTILGIIAILLK
jgi:hypothetical protein